MDCEISVVVPVHNEEENVAPLIDEIAAALGNGPAFEMIFVNDYSDDRTLDALKSLKASYPNLRILSHERRCGQSSAIRTGVLAATGPVIVTLDGDGQNDPADIPAVWGEFNSLDPDSPVAMVAGRRLKRKDSSFKRLASSWANGIRRFVLQDKAVDVGCGLKVFRREHFIRLPYFDNMHRYLPALMLREGYEIQFVDVSHRPRLHGRSNYGVFDRLWVSISDLIGVLWLRRRCTLPNRLKED